jgi:hypothetical protein
LAEISKIFFSDTTWRMELKIVMNDWNHTWQKCSLQGPYQESGFRGEYLNVIFYQNMPNFHNRCTV